MYVTLSSADSLQFFPDNNGGNFRVQLQETLHLNSSYEVALSEIIYKRSWINIQEENHFIIFEYLNVTEEQIEHDKWLETNVFSRKNNLFITYQEDGETLESTPKIKKIIIKMETVNSLEDFMKSIRDAYEKLTSSKLKFKIDFKTSSEYMYTLQKEDESKQNVKWSKHLQDLLGFNDIMIKSHHSRITNLNMIKWKKKEFQKRVHKFALPTGQYDEVKDILKVFDNQFSKVSLDLSIKENELGHIKFHVNGTFHKGYKLVLSPSLREIFGFKSSQLESGSYLTNDTLNETESFLPSELDRNTETLWIYCNIVSPQIVGENRSNLLRIVPYRGRGKSTNVITFNPPHYLSLSLYQINTIHIEIFNTFGLKPIRFESDVIVKLHFRKSI